MSIPLFYTLSRIKSGIKCNIIPESKTTPHLISFKFNGSNIQYVGAGVVVVLFCFVFEYV